MSYSYTQHMLNQGEAHTVNEESESREIALGLRRRDPAILQILVERFERRLVRYLICLLAKQDGIDDLVQETWLRVLQRGSTFDGCSRFEPWLFTIARNLAFDEARRGRTISLHAGDDTGSSPSVMVSDAPSPFLLAARSKDAERLAATMQQLSPLFREVLMLRFQDDLSLQEIASIVDAPVSTVASRSYRGLAILRTQLGDAR